MFYHIRNIARRAYFDAGVAALTSHKKALMVDNVNPAAPYNIYIYINVHRHILTAHIETLVYLHIYIYICTYVGI